MCRAVFLRPRAAQMRQQIFDLKCRKLLLLNADSVINHGCVIAFQVAVDSMIKDK